MSRPAIAITCSFDLDHLEARAPRSYIHAAYTDAIFAAGGLPRPLAVPPNADRDTIDALLDGCSGLLFTGGADLDPRHYGQPPHAQTHVMHRRRDAFELELFREADRRAFPILSICLGCQVASVARGGCLVQHVDDLPRPSPVQHHCPDHTSAFHDVTVDPDSRLARITGRRNFEVNSRHHQIVDRSQVGGGLRPVAFAPDGVVEAVEEASDRFLVAVQWHPEDLIDRPEHLALFQALVQEAARSRRA
jgi:putative glutamine amidotransferase